MRRVSVTLALAAIGCSLVRRDGTSTRTGIAEAGDERSSLDTDAGSVRRRSRRWRGGIAPADRCSVLYRETFEGLVRCGHVERSSPSCRTMGRHVLARVGQLVATRASRLTAKAGGHSLHLSLGVGRPARPACTSWMSANWRALTSDCLRLAAIGVPKEGQRPPHILVTSQGVRLDGAGAYQMIPHSTNGWHGCHDHPRVDGASASVRRGGWIGDRGQPYHQDAAHRVRHRHHGERADGASDFSIDDLGSTDAPTCTPTSFRGRRQSSSMFGWSVISMRRFR